MERPSGRVKAVFDQALEIESPAERAARWAGWLLLEAYLVTLAIGLANAPLLIADQHAASPVGLLVGPPVVLLTSVALVAGFLLGRPGHEGLVPSAWIAQLVGGNSLGANLFAAISGALMYFATLTEVPILQGLIGSGMGQGPALTLLLAGPALSLPSMIVINSIFGPQRTATYVGLVIAMATLTGWLYGIWCG